MSVKGKEQKRKNNNPKRNSTAGLLFSSADDAGPQRRGLTVSDKAALACWIFTSPVCFLLIFWDKNTGKVAAGCCVFLHLLNLLTNPSEEQEENRDYVFRKFNRLQHLYFLMSIPRCKFDLFFLVRYSSGGKEWRSICSLDLQKTEMDKAVFVKWPCKHCMDCVLCVHECVKILYLRVEITLEVSTFMNTAQHLATKSDIFHRTNKIQYFRFMLGIWWQKPGQNTSDQDCGKMIVNKI